MTKSRVFSYKKKENITSEVLDAFQKVSPSRIEVEDTDSLDDYTQKLFNLFYKVLKFPPQLMDQKKVLDFGCGTGEVDLVLANWGADVEGFDFNPDSVERAQALQTSSSSTGKLKFSVGDVHTFDFTPGSFDIVISMGVIAHVQDQRLMFSRMIEACKPGGFIVLGYIDSFGLIQRLLHRAIIKTCSEDAKMNEESVHKMAMSLFGEHIERSVQSGGRTAASVINDYLVNPHYLGIDLNEILEWIAEENVDLYSYWPNLDYPFAIDSPYKDNNPAKLKTFKSWSSFLKLRWMYALQEDEDVFSSIEKEIPRVDKEIESLIHHLNEVLQNEDINEKNINEIKVTLGSIEEKVSVATETFHNYISSSIGELNGEMIDVLELILNTSKNRELVDLKPIAKRLFRGYNGLGTNYMVLYKDKYLKP